MTLTIGLVCPPTLKYRSELFFPVNLTILSSAAKEAGFGAKIIDFNPLAESAGPSFYEEIIANIVQELDRREKECDILGFTTLCSTYPLILQVAEICKKRYGKPVIFGGVQATLTAHETMEAFDSADVIVMHEGEETLQDLMRAYADGAPLSDVKGIVYKEKGVVHDTAPRGFYSDLDDSPFPDFDAIDLKAYKKIYPNLRVPLDIGRACPFACTFCSTSVMWGRKCRFKSPGRVVAEMDALNGKYGITNFFFTQDNFTTNSRYVREFCGELKKRDYTWDCYSRVDTLDYSLIDEMKDAGCCHIFFGIESASPKTQKLIGKNISLERAEKSIQECIKRKIPFTTSYIVGFPEEGRDDVERTLKSILHDAARQTYRVMLNILAPFPGTEITAQYRDRLVSPLVYQPDASPFDLINKAAEKAKEWILAYPDIFTAYYFIRPDNFTLGQLYEIRRFCGMLIDNFACTVHSLVNFLNLSLFDLLSRYKEEGRLIDPLLAVHEDLPRFLEELIEDNLAGLGNGLRLVKNLYRYEQTVNVLRNQETPKDVFESVGYAAERCLAELAGLKVRLTPASVLVDFDCDIGQTFENLRHDVFEAAGNSQRLIFYHDVVLDDIVTVELDEMAEELIVESEKNPVDVEKLLADVERKEIHAEMVRKGILVIVKEGKDGF